jgi:site-specific recombinase XerC
MNLMAARDLWLAELSTNGPLRWTLRNHKRAADEAFKVIAARHETRPDRLKIVDHADVVAAMAAYFTTTGPATGAVRWRSQSTMPSFATALRSFFTWCAETEKIERNPMARVKRPKQPIRVPKAMGAEQCQQLLGAAGQSRSPERDTLMVLLGLTMGLRLAEIASVKPVDFHPALEEPTHLRVVGKGNKERRVPIPQVVRGALAAWLPVRDAQLARWVRRRRRCSSPSGGVQTARWT